MLKKTFVLLFVLLAAASFAFADDWDSFDTAVAEGGSFDAADESGFGDFDDFGSGFDSGFGDFGSSSEPEVKIGAVVDADFRYYLNDDDNPVKALPKAKVSFDYDADKASAKLVFDVNQDKWENSKIDLIDELVISAYLGNLTVEAGKMRIVWGKGDKIHVLDNFNADNYVNFLVPDYIERRISIPMIRALYSVPTESNLVLEAVYAPFLVKNRYNASGMYTPYSVSHLTDTLLSSVAGGVLSPYSQRIQEIIADLNSDAATKILYPNTYRLKYGQYGARGTFTLGRFDMGVSYYNGWYKDPSFNAVKFAAWEKRFWEKPDFLAFDHKQTFGMEAATTVGRFNLRSELAFNLTEDENGKSAFVHNNSLGYVFGFDVDLPLWNMNLNVQDLGTVIFAWDHVKDNHKALSSSGADDADYNSHGPTENMIVANLSASFVHDKLKPEVTAVWVVEKQDFVVIPKIGYDLTPNLNVNFQWLHAYSHDTESKFRGFDTGDMVQLGARYQF